MWKIYKIPIETHTYQHFILKIHLNKFMGWWILMYLNVEKGDDICFNFTRRYVCRNVNKGIIMKGLYHIDLVFHICNNLGKPIITVRRKVFQMIRSIHLKGDDILWLFIVKKPMNSHTRFYSNNEINNNETIDYPDSQNDHKILRRKHLVISLCKVYH